MDMTNPPDIKGYFWLDSSPDSKVAGHLHCTDSGDMVVELIGTLGGVLGEAPDGPMRILGYTSNGKYITLVDCYPAGGSTHVPGFSVATYRSTYTLVGCRIPSAEPLDFHGLAFQSDILDNWYEFGGFIPSQSHDPYHLTIEWSPPAITSWKIRDGLTVALYPTARIPGWGKHNSVSLRQMTWTALRFDTPVALGDLVDLAVRTAGFFSFVTDEPVPFLAVQLEQEKDPTSQKLDAVALYFNMGKRQSTDARRGNAPYPLFPFAQVKASFGATLNQWLERYEALKAPFNLYFSARDSEGLFLENEFLMLAQALEALHRHSSKKKPYDDETYDVLKAALKAAIGPEFQDWLKPKLDFGNELSLSERLSDLFSTVGNVFGDTVDPVTCAKQIRDTRNYLTHYSSSLKKKSATGHAMFRLCLVMECLFRLHLARLTGFSKENVDHFAKSSQSFSQKLLQISQLA
ncbi:hypothetical protein FIV34_11685 [Luteibacter pinisoli]|uniref:Uncharacterized protein n=1 Tax=Luteibacter pinisoli TaxID=2589080 RepID=A0A4Y5Z390_9GAMM|nr:HEPN domain-containing protein [Luteibacter pinisoli]QDE39822.1 hypothetical protein FIV34_11685 [Luteibacter pinisoli]